MPWIRSRPFRQEPPVRTREAAAPFAFSPGPRAWRVRHILPAWRRTAAERAWYGSSPIAKTGRSCKRSCRRRSFILMTKKTPLPRSKRRPSGASAVAVGPGLRQGTDAAALLLSCLFLCKEKKIPCVIDADGINLLAAQYHKKETQALFSEKPLPFVLTPHPGEMARLFAAVTGETASVSRDSCVSAHIQQANRRRSRLCLPFKRRAHGHKRRRSGFYKSHGISRPIHGRLR